MIARFYAALLRLYPHQFRAKFGDEMKAIFRQAIADHDRTGKSFRFFLRELRDLLPNLAREHWYALIKKEFHMTIIKKPDWTFYPVWVILTTLCIPIAFILDLVILKAIISIVGDFIYVNGVQHVTEDYLFSYTFVPVSGLLTGVLQYWLLRRYLPRMGWWVLATTGGWLLGLLIILIPGWLDFWKFEVFDLDLAFILMGLSIGVGQWLLLRHRLSQAGWWVVATVLGWSLLSLLTTGNSIGQYGLLILGFLPACVTAMVFALLMKLTSPTEIQNG